MASPSAERSHLFALLSRMRFIRRWSLMHNTWPENVQEHSTRVAMIAHVLALLRNRRHGGDLDPERVALIALYHDASEVLTGDLPTPVKYFNPNMRSAYGVIEEAAVDRLIDAAPAELRDDFAQLLRPGAADAEHLALVKAADKICALMKCVEERSAGNPEFARAEKALERAVAELPMPEVRDFVDLFLPSMSLTLDELD